MSTVLTLADIAKRTDPDGMPAMIAELLHQSNPILDDIPWMPSNLPTSHRSTIRTGLPTVNLRRLNQGSASSKSTTEQIEDGMSLVDAWSTTDEDLLAISGNAGQTRLGEGEAFIEAMGQKVTELFFYGSTADDDREFNGLSVRYNSTAGNVTDNIISGGGSGADLASVWLVGWAPNKVFGIYPKNSVAGLRHKDHGVQIIQESTALGGSKLSALVDQWKWDCGLVVKDWRYVVRMPNIDIADALVAATGTAQALDDYDNNIMFVMTKARHRIPNLAACRPVYYMPRSLLEAFDVQALARTTQNVFSTMDVEGQTLTTFRGIPMRPIDQLLVDEAAVS